MLSYSMHYAHPEKAIIMCSGKYIIAQNKKEARCKFEKDYPYKIRSIVLVKNPRMNLLRP